MLRLRLFANNAIPLLLLLVFLFFLIIDFYFLIAAVTAQVSNTTAELVIPTRIPTKEAKAEIETRNR